MRKSFILNKIIPKILIKRYVHTYIPVKWLKKNWSQSFYTNIKRKFHQKLFLSIPYTNKTFSFTKLFYKPVPQVGETSIKSFPNSIHGLEVFWFVGGFPYWVLYMYCRRLSVRAKNSSKSNFLKVDLFGWGCWEIDLVLEMSWFDPKWHPKSLVLVSYTCWWYNRVYGEGDRSGYHLREWNEISFHSLRW